jgi:hypothetical protein
MERKKGPKATLDAWLLNPPEGVETSKVALRPEGNLTDSEAACNPQLNSFTHGCVRLGKMAINI